MELIEGQVGRPFGNCSTDVEECELSERSQIRDFKTGSTEIFFFPILLFSYSKHHLIFCVILVNKLYQIKITL